MSVIENFIRTLKGKPIAVLGMGASGLSVASAFIKAGAKVLCWDDNRKSCLFAEQIGAEVVDLDRNILRTCAFLVSAPGIAPRHPVIAMAREVGLEVFCDIELFHRLGHGHKTIGITGTNGKSTTTALAHHVLKEGGLNAVKGGNIGKPVFDLKIPDEPTVFVFELSSYQLELCPTYRPDIAVLLNITPDHLDWHGSLENYIAAKARIFEGPGRAIVSVDDDECRKIAADVQTRNERHLMRISLGKPVREGLYVEDHKLYDQCEGEAREIMDLRAHPVLKGAHNAQNIMAAYGIARDLDILPELFVKAAMTFKGLPHRQFPARTIGRVTYINDSKATNAEAAAKALEAYDNIFWIVGGRAKAGGLDGLEIYKDRIRHSYLIGEAAPAFQRWMGRLEFPHTLSRVLQVALRQAHEDAQDFTQATGKSAVVLLAPACASFDQFKSFEKRGDLFMSLVAALKDSRV